MIDAHLTYGQPQTEAPPTLVNEVRATLGMLRRHIKLILILAPVGFALGYAGSYLMTPSYQAVAQLSLDPRRVAIAAPVNAQSQRRDEPMIDSGRADSEAQTIQSESVIRSVVTTLDLQNDPEFNQPPGIRSRIRSFITGPGDPLTEEDRILNTMGAVGDKLKVERVAQSYVFTIMYEARNPALAARVANAFATVYIKKQLDAEYDAAREAVTWLKGRTAQLAAQTEAADRAASDYQNQARISRSDGKLIDEKQLELLSTQLTDVAAERAQAKARYDRAMQTSPDSVTELAVADAFQNTVISKLRTDYLALKNQGDSLAARYGQTHAAVIKLRTDAKAIERSIRTELLRYQQSFKNDYEVAVEREKAIRADLEAQVEKAAATGSAQVKLNALESDARAMRAAYDGFMQRYTEALQRQSFPVSEARVIGEALEPTQPSKPKRPLFAAAGFMLALMGGVGAAFAIELMNRRIRTRAEAEAASGVECLGYVPRVAPPKNARVAGRTLPLDYVARNPYTVAAETLRTLKTTIDYRHLGPGCPVVGMISCVPDEGKTSLSVNFAYMLAQNDRRVLLIDGDMRNPSLSNAIAPVTIDPSTGEVNALSPSSSVTVVRRDDLPFHFIPALSTTRPEFADYARSALAESGRKTAATSLEADYFHRLIDAAKHHYDYIIVDLPPIVPLSDVRAVSRSISAFALVMAWGKSQPDIVSDALESIPGISEKLVGSVLNMADVKSLPRYGEYVSTYYNSKYFSQ